jgi:hypothetical protein
MLGLMKKHDAARGSSVSADVPTTVGVLKYGPGTTDASRGTSAQLP